MNPSDNPNANRLRAIQWLMAIALCAIAIGALAVAINEARAKTPAIHAAARAHVETERELMIAQTARWIATQHWLTSDLGQPYIERRLRSSLQDNPPKTPMPYIRLFSREWELSSLITLEFEVSSAEHNAAPAQIKARMPFAIKVDTLDNAVTGFYPATRHAKLNVAFPIGETPAASPNIVRVP